MRLKSLGVHGSEWVIALEDPEEVLPRSSVGLTV